jgi:purine-cytosine permease-like protein
LGFLVASVSEPGADLVTAMLFAQGGLLALGLILLDELDNAYGDVYSGAVSANSLKPAWSIRRWGLSLALLCTTLALILPMHSLEPFLLMLSSVFVPLYGVILGRGSSITASPNNALTPKVNIVAAALWLLGIGVFHAAAAWAPQYGSALPTLLLTFLLARLTRGQAQ